MAVAFGWATLLHSARGPPHCSYFGDRCPKRCKQDPKPNSEMHLACRRWPSDKQAHCKQHSTIFPPKLVQAGNRKCCWCYPHWILGQEGESTRGISLEEVTGRTFDAMPGGYLHVERLSWQMLLQHAHTQRSTHLVTACPSQPSHHKPSTYDLPVQHYYYTGRLRLGATW